MDEQPTLREVLEPSVERMTVKDIEDRLALMDYDEETGAKHLLYVDWLDDDTLNAVSDLKYTCVTVFPLMESTNTSPTLIYILQLNEEAHGELVAELGDDDAVDEFIHQGNSASMSKHLFETLLGQGFTHLIEQLFPVVKVDLKEIMEHECSTCEDRDECKDRGKEPGLITRKVLDA